MNTDTEKSEIQVKDEAVAEKKLLEPFEFLQTFPNAPSKATVEAWKAQAPNGIVRIFSPGTGAKRAYIVRGISGQELRFLQSQLPENLGAGLTPEARAAKIELETSLRVGAHCTLWTSTTQDTKLTQQQLDGGSAGLPSTLFNLITYLSDFLDPESINLMSAEL